MDAQWRTRQILILTGLGAVATRQVDEGIDITQRIAAINMVQTMRHAQRVTTIRRRDCTSPQYGGIDGHRSPLTGSGTGKRKRPAENPMLDRPAIHWDDTSSPAKRPRTLWSSVTISAQSLLQDLGSSTPHAWYSECNPAQQIDRPGLQDVDFTEAKGPRRRKRSYLESGAAPVKKLGLFGIKFSSWRCRYDG